MISSWDINSTLQLGNLTSNSSVKQDQDFLDGLVLFCYIVLIYQNVTIIFVVFCLPFIDLFIFYIIIFRCFYILYYSVPMPVVWTTRREKHCCCYLWGPRHNMCRNKVLQTLNLVLHLAIGRQLFEP